MRKLIVDPVIQRALRPLSPEEYTNLETNILADGEVLDPIKVWKGRDIIVDGHHRWKIINEHGISKYKVAEIEFADYYEVVTWVWKHQKGRRNENPNDLAITIGRAYDSLKKDRGFQGNQYTVEVVTSQVDQSAEPWTVEVVAKDYDVSPKSVQRASQFVKVLDSIEEKTSPEVVERITSIPEKVPISHLQLIDAELDKNPEYVVEYQGLTKVQKARQASYFIGLKCIGGDPLTLREVARQMGIDPKTVLLYKHFATLVSGVEPVDPALADWIMNTPGFAIRRASALLDEHGNPVWDALKCVKAAIDAKETFDAGVERWEEFCKAKESGSDKIRRVIENSAADKREVEKMADKIFGSAQSVCIRPDIKELCCAECGAGFNLLLPSPADAKHCPCCGGSKIESRPPGWSPLEG